MSIKFSAGETSPVVLAATETFFENAMEDLVGAIAAVRQGRLTEAKVAVQAVRDLKQAFFAMMEERNRVEKLRKQVAEVVQGSSVDFDAARDEIGRRLACLRDA